MKILKISFQNFLYHERLYYWICFYAWLTLCYQWRLQKFKRENCKQPGKIRYCILVKKFSWDNMAFLCGISLLPEKKALFFSILQKQSSRGVLRPATLLKKRLWRRCFRCMNFVKFLRTLFLQDTSGGCSWSLTK